MAHEPRRKEAATSEQPPKHKHRGKGKAQKYGPQAPERVHKRKNTKTRSTREWVGSEEGKLESTPSPARSGAAAGETGNKNLLLGALLLRANTTNYYEWRDPPPYPLGRGKLAGDRRKGARRRWNWIWEQASRRRVPLLSLSKHCLLTWQKQLFAMCLSHTRQTFQKVK
jgi:hypothetical protein